MLKKRCHFIAEKQQYHKKGDALDGCYLIYDKESDRQYYSHLVHDHNGGRERMGMAVLIARYLQLDDDPLLEESLKKYLDYFYRELYDRNSGTVYNDMQRNNDWHRLYNYAWAATLQTEVYKWSVNPVYLSRTDSLLRASHPAEGGFNVDVQHLFINTLHKPSPMAITSS